MSPLAKQIRHVRWPSAQGALPPMVKFPAPFTTSPVTSSPLSLKGIIEGKLILEMIINTIYIYICMYTIIIDGYHGIEY